MIPAVIERCIGIDVGKTFLLACLMIGPADGEARSEVRQFGTTVGELKRLREWIEQEQCTHAIMESTGSYWKPVFNVIEGALEVALVNPHEVKARKGHKTDAKDAWWLAHLLRHGMITPSFIPKRPQRELRDLTRRRKKLIGAATGEKNRIDKILQDANVKLSNVLSDLFGVSGQLILEALLEGRADAEQIAQFAKRRAKKKVPEIIASVAQHQMSDHHRMMIRFSLEHLRFLEEQVFQLDEQIRNKIHEAGYDQQWDLLQTLPAVGEDSAAILLAEMGPDPKQFASEKHLSSWAGVCPGNNRSAGKSKSSHVNAGNSWLRNALTQSAWALSRAKKKGQPLREKFWRIAAKNRMKAVVAVAHDLLVLAYFVLSRGTPYQERLGVELTEPQKQRLIRHHVRRLGKLGIFVPTMSVLSTGRRKCRRSSVTSAIQ